MHHLYTVYSAIFQEKAQKEDTPLSFHKWEKHLAPLTAIWSLSSAAQVWI